MVDAQKKKLEGGPMKVLVDGGKLKRADILLSHTKGSLLGRLIRWGTDSYWNHAFMIYTVAGPKQGYDATFIIESGGAGIDIHNITHYFNRPRKFDVAVKRFEADWFQDDSAAGGLRYRKRIRGFALKEIDDKYNHKLIMGIAWRFLRQLVLGVLIPWTRIRKRPLEQRQVGVPRIARKLNISTYICSGFVQWAYFKAVSRIRGEDKSKTPEIQEILFNPRFDESVTEDDLLATTPADLARSKGLTWKYVIKDGNVWEVSTEEHVNSIVNQ